MPTPLPAPEPAYAALTAVGRVRQHNEDAILCCPRFRLWALADGMGGHRCGEVASALALKTLQSLVRRGDDLVGAIHATHAAILAEAERDASQHGMGTTLVAVRLDGAEFELAWVGDSRGYRVGSSRIEQLTHDHSWVQMMVDAGQLSGEQARSHPRRNVLTQCLGGPGQALEVGRVCGRLDYGELLLLCSDGLTGELSDVQIQQCCAAAATLDDMVGELVEAANRRGGKDNISCIVLGLSAPPPVAMEARPRSFLDKLLKPAKS